MNNQVAQQSFETVDLSSSYLYFDFIIFGVAFLIVALSVIVSAVLVYHWRKYESLNPRSKKYEYIFMVVCGVLVGILATSAIMFVTM